MSNSIDKEINRLETIIDYCISIDLDNLDFTQELALIRAIEEVGGIGKKIERFGINLSDINPEWKFAIRARDKISHSYESLEINTLISSLKQIRTLKKDINKIRNKLK